MTKIKVPCYNCEKRNAQCHASCEAYKEYRREYNEKRALLKAYKAKESNIVEVTIKAVKRMRKRKQASEHSNARKGR